MKEEVLIVVVVVIFACLFLDSLQNAKETLIENVEIVASTREFNCVKDEQNQKEFN